MGWNPFKEAEKKAKSAVNSVIKKILNPAIDRAEDVAGDVQRKARNAASDAERKVNSLADKAEDKIEDAQKLAVREVRKAGEEVKDGITEDLPELIEDAMEKISEEAVEQAMSKALDAFLDGVEIMAPTRAAMTFGMALSFVVEGEIGCRVVVPNPVAKLTEIRKWAANPPKGRAKIIECVKDFGPESIEAGFKICGNGPDFEWDGDDKYDRIDAFLAKHGVD